MNVISGSFSPCAILADLNLTRVSNRMLQYRWTIVGVTLVNQALTLGIMIYSFALFVVPWLETFGISRSQAMLAIFMFQVICGFISPIFGRLMDTYSMRGLVVLGGFSASLGLCLISYTTAFWQIVLIHMTLLPVGMMLCGTLASQTMVSKWFTDKRGLAIGISSMGTSMGGLTIPLLANQLIEHNGWQDAIFFLGIVMATVIMPLNLWILRKEPPEPEQSAKDGRLDTKSWGSREILSTRNFWIPVIGLIPINAAFGGVQFNIGAYVADLGMTQEIAAQLIALASISMIIGKFVFGSLGDRIDHRYLYWFMTTLLLLALFFYQDNPDKDALMLAAALQGFATGGVMPMMGIMYASRFGTLSFGRVLGLVNLFLMIGSFGSLFSGWMFDLTQSYDVAFWTFSALLIPVMVAMAFLPPPARSH